MKDDVNFNSILPKTKGNWFNIILANMIAIVIVALGFFMPLLSFALAFIAIAYMQIGVYGYVLNTFRNKKPDFESIFLHPKQIVKILIIKIIAMCGMAIWGLLLFVPGIIYGLNCSFAGLIYYDNPTLTTKQIFEQSKTLTFGHRFTIFITIMGMVALVCSGASLGVGLYFIFTLFMKVPAWLTVMLIVFPAAVVFVTLALPMFESFLVQIYEDALTTPAIDKINKQNKITVKKVSKSK